jgi:SAM-dependent methyltransferase
MERHRGVEILDTPQADAALAERSLRDVAIANALLGGTRAVTSELDLIWGELPRSATLLDVGTGLGDIAAQVRVRAAEAGVQLTTVGVEITPALAHAGRPLAGFVVCADARHLPFASHSVDIVICSQVLHHFFGADAQSVLHELDRVGRRRVVVSDLRRSRLAAAGIWLSSFLFRFHPVSRHDGVISVLRGFRAGELAALVRTAVGRVPEIRHHLGYRLTAAWTPGP